MTPSTETTQRSPIQRDGILRLHIRLCICQVKYVMINTRLTNQSIIKVKYIYKKHNNRKTQFSFFLLPFMFGEKEDRVSFHDRMPTILCRSYAKVITIVSLISVPHREDSIHTSLVPFSSSYSFSSIKLPESW